MTTSGVHGLNPILKYLPTFSANWPMSRITNFLGGFLSNGKIYNSTLDLLIPSPRFLSSWPNLVKICLIINFLMEDLSAWTELLVKDHFLKVILIHHYHRHNRRHIIMITLILMITKIWSITIQPVISTSDECNKHVRVPQRC